MYKYIQVQLDIYLLNVVTDIFLNEIYFVFLITVLNIAVILLWYLLFESNSITYRHEKNIRNNKGIVFFCETTRRCRGRLHDLQMVDRQQVYSYVYYYTLVHNIIICTHNITCVYILAGNFLSVGLAVYSFVCYKNLNLEIILDIETDQRRIGNNIIILFLSHLYYIIIFIIIRRTHNHIGGNIYIYIYQQVQHVMVNMIFVIIIKSFY